MLFSQSIEKCYYLIKTLGHFIVNNHHHVHIFAHPTCIFNSCIALDEILHFIKGWLHSIGDKDIDCPHCLLTLKHQLVFYLKLFQRIRRLRLDSYLSATFKCSVIQSSHQVRTGFVILSPVIYSFITSGSLIKLIFKEFLL